MLQTEGRTLRRFTKRIHKFCEAQQSHALAPEFIAPLAEINKEWGDLTMHVGLAAMNNPEEVGAASVDYLMYSGYVCLAYFWAQAALLASEKSDTGEAEFYQAKLKTARFYFQRLLPRTRTLVATIKSGADNLLAMDESQF